MTEHIYLQGFFVGCDKYGRGKIMFLDDYDRDLNKMSFTKSYLTNLCKTINGNNPITETGEYFYVKCPKRMFGSINDEIVPLCQLYQHKVEIDIIIKKYKFKKFDETIQGWCIKPIKIKLLAM